jgi:hypothetical protein
MPSSTPKPGTGVSGLYFADDHGTVLDCTGIVVATTGDRFTVEFHSGHRATYTLNTEVDFWERTERAPGYVAKWVAERGHEQPVDAADFARVMLGCARRPNADDLHKALAILSLPRDRVERLMAPFAEA